MWDDDDTRQYAVVINHEEQYSIWPVDRKVPSGWKEVGKRGTRKECLAYLMRRGLAPLARIGCA